MRQAKEIMKGVQAGVNTGSTPSHGLGLSL